jgi:hypothetical protein
MKLFKYNQFLRPKNDDLNKSRKFLKEREMLMIAITSLGLLSKDLDYELKNGERRSLKISDFTPEEQQQIKLKLREIKLSDQDLKKLEKDEGFVKLKELLKDNLGYLYSFIYMYYVEMTPIQEIEEMYKKLIEYKQILDKLVEIPEVGKKFDVNFIDANLPNEDEHRTNSEILAEGLDKLADYKKVKKILDTLTPKLKNAYKNATDLQKEEITQIANAFDNLSDEMYDDTISVKDRIWKNFFGEMRTDSDEYLPDGKKNPNFGKKVYKSRLKRFEDSDNPIRNFISAAKSHLAASEKSGYSEKIEKITDCNDKFGINGCDVVFDQKGILIIKINSFASNRFMNSHTNHCIVNYESYWNSYQGEFNVQYYIYNINLSSLDEYNTIGVTIKPDRTWTSGACQTVRNTSVNNFKKVLKDWEKEYQIDVDLFSKLEPLSKEEVERRKKAKEAERKIVERGITLEQLKEYVTVYGANVNKDNCKALVNSVEEENYEKTKYILIIGGDPNLLKGENSAISKAKDLDTIKLLVTYGANMEGEVFKNIITDVDAVEFCLKAGMDPNFNNSLPFRTVIRGSYKNKNDIGESYLDVYKVLLKNGAKVYNDIGRNMVLKWALDYARFDIIEYTQKTFKFTKDEWEAAYKWIKHGSHVNDETKEKVKEYSDEQMNKLS